jgi:ABC-type glycerol-3-phosphate transport system permease component
MITAEKTRALGFLGFARPARRRRSRRFDEPTPLGLVLRYAMLIFMLVVSVGPMLWELSTSLKGQDEDIYSLTPQLLPQHPTFASYGEVQRNVPVWHFAANSVTVAALNIVGNLIFTTLAGYALARLQFRGRKLVLGLFLSTLIVPGEATIIAQFQLVRNLGLGDQLFGVALPGLCGMINVLLMRNAFLGLPKEIDEAAIIDGANAWQRLTRVALPHVFGTMSVIAIMTFIGAWDDFLWPLLVLNSPDKLTLTVGLS